MDPCIPIPVDPVVLGDLVEKAKDYALMHGEINSFDTLCSRKKPRKKRALVSSKYQKNDYIIMDYRYRGRKLAHFVRRHHICRKLQYKSCW
jgi:hypothetical protein